MQLLAFLLTLIVTSSQGEALRAGVMVTSAGRGVMALAGPVLSTDTPVTLVTLEHAQQVCRAVLARRLSDSETLARHQIPGPYYEVVPELGAQPLPDLAIAIVGRSRVERAGSTVTLRVGNPPVRVRARSCASSEGLHLTLWAGVPLEGARLWHVYYYLGYDVEPTCQPRDYRDGG